MIKFNQKIAAGVFVGLGLIYMVASLAASHTVRAELQPGVDDQSGELGIDAWQVATLIIDSPKNVKIVDVRDKSDYDVYHIPGSINLPGANSKLLKQSMGVAKLILVAAKDEQASLLLSELRRADKQAPAFFLKGGARSWYLTFELPVPLFSDQDPPVGYFQALRTLRAYFDNPSANNQKQASNALATLTRVKFEPTLLQNKAKPKAGKKKKKLSGGCG